MDTFSLSAGEFGITFSQPMRDSEGWLDFFAVEIEEPGLSATAKVENSRFIQGPETFFADLANNWLGWAGEKTWHALEGELDLVATADSQGHVKLQVRLRPDAGPDSWQVTSYAYLEAGQLDSISYRARQFFGREP